MAKNKREVWKLIKDEDGLGGFTEFFSDGTSVHRDGKTLTNPENLPSIRDLEKFLTDLQKNPKDVLLRQYALAYLSKVPYMEDDKTTAKEILDKIAEISGALQTQQQHTNIVAIEIRMPNTHVEHKVIEVQAKGI